MNLTAIFKQVPEGYIAFIEELPGANTQGTTLAEARANLQEAVQLVFEANKILAEEMFAEPGCRPRTVCHRRRLERTKRIVTRRFIAFFQGERDLPALPARLAAQQP